MIAGATIAGAAIAGKTIAGATWEWWVGFHVVVAVLLLADSFLPGHRRESRHVQAFVWLTTVGLALVAAGFACWMAVTMGKQTALEFVAGYTIETSLSIDNLFVFLVLFEGFRISAQRQHTALQWGVWGAFVLRACVHCGGRHAAAALRVGHVGLRADSAVCGVAAGARRLGARGDSGVDRAACSRRRDRCCR